MGSVGGAGVLLPLLHGMIQEALSLHADAFHTDPHRAAAVCADLAADAELEAGAGIADSSRAGELAAAVLAMAEIESAEEEADRGSELAAALLHKMTESL